MRRCIIVTSLPCLDVYKANVYEFFIRNGRRKRFKGSGSARNTEKGKGFTYCEKKKFLHFFSAKSVTSDFLIVLISLFLFLRFLLN